MTSSIQAVAGAGLLALKVIPRLHPLTQPGPASGPALVSGQPEVRVRSLAFLATGSSHLRTPSSPLPG